MAHTNALALVLDNRQRVCVRHFVAWFLRHRSSGGYHPSCFALFTLTGYLTDQISGTAITRRTLVRRSARHLGISGGIPRDNATFGKSVALATQGCENRSEEHTSELQSRLHLVCRLLLEKKKQTYERDTLFPHHHNQTARLPELHRANILDLNNTHHRKLDDSCPHHPAMYVLDHATQTAH